MQGLVLQLILCRRLVIDIISPGCRATELVAEWPISGVHHLWLIVFIMVLDTALVSSQAISPSEQSVVKGLDISLFIM